jgi:extracellular elastinolytic metalloproteinase
VAAELNIPQIQLKVSSNFTDNMGVTHVYLNRFFEGYQILNHNAAVHFQNQVTLSFTTSFSPAKKNIDVRFNVAPYRNMESAIRKAEVDYGARRRSDDQSARHSLLQVRSGQFKLVTTITLDDFHSKWLIVAIDDDSHEVLQVVNYYSHANDARYKVFDLPKSSPEEGFTFIDNPFSLNASPNGWHGEYHNGECYGLQKVCNAYSRTAMTTIGALKRGFLMSRMASFIHPLLAVSYANSRK